jgi:integrase/recombinase XerD
VRYADDIVAGFEHQSEAVRFLAELRKRLEKFALSLHPDKTRPIEFGRHAAADRAKRGLGKPETFNFLGYVFLQLMLRCVPEVDKYWVFADLTTHKFSRPLGWRPRFITEVQPCSINCLSPRWPSRVIRKHPMPEERRQYLAACAQQGNSHSTLLFTAQDLFWVADKLSAYPHLHQVTLQQIRAVARDWRKRERVHGQVLNKAHTRQRYLRLAASWLRFLGHLQTPTEPIPFEPRLDEYCRWAREERGLSEASVKQFYRQIRYFLMWYGALERDLADVDVNDVDRYLTRGGTHGWSRITVNNVATALRCFFRYCAQRHWTRDLADGIQGPRIYALEGLPAGPDWSDVRRLFASLDAKNRTDIRDRPILMLMAIYGLRASEVARLRLEHLDWEHDRLRVPRAKRRAIDVYPLQPSVRDALIRYLQTVRRQPTLHRQVFLTVMPPFRPISASSLHHVAAHRLKQLGVRTAHHGPHSLRHACAARLVAEGLSLKEIGDHLGHRSTSATRIYAKVDLRGLREVAAFDVGELL